ncbi:hypothetical protein llap_6937 [Limosa lapponica baueri]|uniref:Uncharacterized protein n=1 Tax=Limosa lapponica baueri TaxID=1758121 RepID=A0A2I0U9L8_LIMLA|nr:hypothetical protein llap_6937 [Limosa lapponica baueri]
MVTSDTAMSSLRNIKKVYKALGVVVRDTGVQIVFSSALLVKGKGVDGASRIWQIKKYVWDWCHSQGFGYLDHRTRFEKPGLLGANGVHLSDKGKSIFSQRLAKLMKRASN